MFSVQCSWNDASAVVHEITVEWVERASALHWDEICKDNLCKDNAHVTWQDGLTGNPFGDFAIKSGSYWLAFENELGVQAPVGFWDPVGFTSDGDVAAFKRRRSVELKHGRISMMATMGVLTARKEQDIWIEMMLKRMKEERDLDSLLQLLLAFQTFPGSIHPVVNWGYITPEITGKLSET